MKIIITITVRTKSTRLPLKVLRLIEGKMLIEHMIERLKLAGLPNEIIVCTSINPQDDILVDVAEKTGIKYFRGSETDVLDRIKGAAQHYNADLVVSTTGDNPFTDPHYIDKLIEYHKGENLDYSATRGLPLGVNSHAVTATALKKACELKREDETEIWGDYFTKSGYFRAGILEVEKEEFKHPDIRMTVDTPEDLKFMREIFHRLYKHGEVIELGEALRLLDNNPEICAINQQVQQRSTPDYVLKDITRFKNGS